ncbi:tRNA (adenosine(37)-N6)-threonylcarbamoyltransferase complex dimerization subunit type 1 TsaB [Sphingomonas sp. PR090111-T3T-6A]|uniref:tRNA (adenosine(37)-N6)-threonylcarbamoyltransferase complex dimerization subunit type 1 TsaB n=1 Tax=Sphingomonas sp. PR090111-T3T-6A TaxID=685778 RepID=UPI000380CDD8|nr:tRNA (adenosine(37)-N6)-threonylcarbamoyltransferase complex dimerization subunit type 1 TsaB [Sphingomonas sp. PR090111-T3T-6A]
MLLAIDTATAACSAALIEGGEVVHAMRELVGRGHAERIVPMVETLLAGADGVTPSAVLVDCGPGSFTGVRVGLAAAIGMGMGWSAPVAGCSSMALVAVRCFADRPELEHCAVALTGGHGELFVQRFAARPFAATGDLVSLPPAEAAAFAPDVVVAGSGAEALVAARGTGEALDILPEAADAARLPEAFRSLPPQPIYGRPPDAKPKAA